MFENRRADLILAAHHLREKIDADGGANAVTVHLPARQARGLRDLANMTAVALDSADDEIRKRDERIRRLESSNGHLMVDRDRTQSRAAGEIAAARELVVKHLGIESPELDMRLREQAEFDRRTLAVLDRDRVAYDTFRVTIISLMHELSRLDVLDGKRLTEVRKIVERANKKALGR